MRFLKSFPILFLVFISPVSATEEIKNNTQQLYQFCQQDIGSEKMLFCAAYISAVGDFMAINGAAVKENSGLKIFSLCGKQSYGAMIQAFKNWAAAHPQHWQTPSILGVITALRETWPCK